MLANKSNEVLDAMAAYHKNKPIRTPEVMSRPLITKPMDAGWKESIRETKFWALNTKEPITPELKPILDLRDKLLTFGGEEGCMPFIEEDLLEIQVRGQLWYGDRINLMEGLPSQCHHNSALLWHFNRDDLLIATGYALSDDGMWRQHSWCVHVKPKNNDIVETTTERVAYFGFVLNKRQSEKFYYENT